MTSAMAMAQYLTSETLQPGRESLARYYTGEMPPADLSPMEKLGRQIAAGVREFSEVMNSLEAGLVRTAGDGNLDEIRDRLMSDLADAVYLAEQRSVIAESGGTNAEVRPDMVLEVARRLGIDMRRPPTVREMANLLSGLRTDGAPIEGKRIKREMQSITDAYKLDGRNLPTGDDVDRIIASKEGPRRRFLTIYGVASGEEPTAEQIANIRAGRRADGLGLDRTAVLRRLNATNPPVAYIDMIWSPHKSVSLAWALAPTDAERAVILRAHKDAVASTMAYVEQNLGFARKGDGGKGGIEPGDMAWIIHHHYTSRPTIEIVQTDKDGNPATEIQEVPTMRTADPQLHTHVTLLNLVMTANGRMGAIDRDRLDGLVKEFGAVYQAFVSTNLMRSGVGMTLERETGATRVTAVPDEIVRHFSKRSHDIESAARELARAEGLDWDRLTPQRKIALLRHSVEGTRLAKIAGRDGTSDFAEWRRQAIEERGYHHASVLRPDAIRPKLTAAQRQEKAYQISLGLAEESLSHRAKIDGQEFREIAARGFVEAGIGNPGEDIAAVTASFRERGVRQDGEMVRLIWGQDTPMRGKLRWSVTTDLHVDQENEVIDRARALALDRSASLPMPVIDAAAERFLAAHPDIDSTGRHFQAQREVINRLGTGGFLGVAVGVAGAGKSTCYHILADAYKAEGRQVYGIATAWKHAARFNDAGIEARDRASIAAFLKRVDTGEYQPDRNAVVMIEEVSLVGKRAALDLLRLQAELGFSIMAIGDSRQGQAISASPALALFERALASGIPELGHAIRQRAELERQTADLFRQGRADLAIELKREDGTAEFVAGGRDATVRRVAALWRERMEERGQEPGFTMTISAPTNADVNAIGLAIREEMRAMGQIGPDIVTVRSIARGEPADMALAVGDKVRIFDRIMLPGRDHFASNGDVLSVRGVDSTGILARNSNGREALVPWDKFRDTPADPVRLQYGAALTVDTVQSVTSSEHIDALPSGSAASHGFKAYVAESRHRDVSWMIVSESAERQQVLGRLHKGWYETISHDDLWRNVGDNLSRQPEKALAVEFMRKGSNLHRGSISGRLHANVPGEMRKAQGLARTVDIQERSALRHAAKQIVAMGHKMAQRLTPTFHMKHHGPSLFP